MQRFQTVNRRGAPDFRPGWNKHHVIPASLRHDRQIADFLAEIWPGFGFDDFSRNGVLLPANDDAACGVGLPVHDGPHPRYNEWVRDELDAIRSGYRPDDRRSACYCRNSVRLMQRRIAGTLLTPRAAIIPMDAVVPFLDFPARSRRMAEVDTFVASWPPMAASTPA